MTTPKTSELVRIGNFYIDDVNRNNLFDARDRAYLNDQGELHDASSGFQRNVLDPYGFQQGQDLLRLSNFVNDRAFFHYVFNGDFGKMIEYGQAMSDNRELISGRNYLSKSDEYNQELVLPICRQVAMEYMEDSAKSADIAGLENGLAEYLQCSQLDLKSFIFPMLFPAEAPTPSVLHSLRQEAIENIFRNAEHNLRYGVKEWLKNAEENVFFFEGDINFADGLFYDSEMQASVDMLMGLIQYGDAKEYDPHKRKAQHYLNAIQRKMQGAIMTLAEERRASCDGEQTLKLLEAAKIFAVDNGLAFNTGREQMILRSATKCANHTSRDAPVPKEEAY